MGKIHVIIVAGGSGSRFGADVPKQYCLLDGRPVLMHTIDAMREAVPFGEMLLVISRDMHPLWQSLCRSSAFESPRVVYGGPTRASSVRNALMSIGAVSPDDVVLIHDGARPLVDRVTVANVLDKLLGSRPDGVIPVVPVTDSIRLITDSGSQPVDRSLYRAVQTPQGFYLGELMQAYERPEEKGWTDDASVMASAGKTDIVLACGSPENIKITNPIDIDLAAAILNRHKK